MRLAYGNTSSSSPPLPPNLLSPDRELEEALRTGQSDIAELREEFTHRIASLEKKLQTVIKVCVCKHTVFMQECNLCNCVLMIVLMSVTASVCMVDNLQGCKQCGGCSANTVVFVPSILQFPLAHVTKVPFQSWSKFSVSVCLAFRRGIVSENSCKLSRMNRRNSEQLQ